MQRCIRDRLSKLRGAATKKRALLGGLIAASVHMPLNARTVDAAAEHEHRSSRVVMMIGGMASGDDAVILPTHLAPAASLPASDDAGRQSVVIQPDGSALNDAVHQSYAVIVSRVMALSPIISEAAHVADVDSALLMAVIEVESGGNPRAVSPKGATGLMQLMPDTGARHGAVDLFDPRQNIAAGARYLKRLMRQFGSLPLALAAYNAGEAAVQKHGTQIPPYPETMNYVPKVIARYRWYQNVSSYASTASVRAPSDGGRGRLLLEGSGGPD